MKFELVEPLKGLLKKCTESIKNYEKVFSEICQSKFRYYASQC